VHVTQSGLPLCCTVKKPLIQSACDISVCGIYIPDNCVNGIYCEWQFALVGNVVGRINEVNQRRAG